MRKHRVGRILKFWFITIAVIINLVVALASLYYLVHVLLDYGRKDLYTSYNVNSAMNYQVFMEKNNYITNDYNGVNASYINKLVDKIKTDVVFEYSNQKQVLKGYDYNIRGTLYAVYKVDATSSDENEIWHQTDNFRKGSTVVYDGNNLNIRQTITTDLQGLANKIALFEKEIDLPVSANYNIELDVNLQFENNNKIIIKNHKSSINIPVDVSVFKIAKNVEPNKEVAIIDDTKKTDINNTYLILAVLLFAFGVMTIIRILHPIYAKKKTKYQKEYEEIFKLYGDRIITVENIVRRPESEFIDVVSFEEMIDLVNELNIPILCWTKEHRDETWFCAIKDNLIYRYFILG